MSTEFEVLVVEGSPTDRRIPVASLGRASYELLEADNVNGIDAVRVARERRPDLVLLDVRMPGQDGFAVCEALESHEETKR